MKRRFTEEQIISVLRAAQQGAKRGRLAPWSKRSSGATGSRSKRLHGLGAEHLLGIHGHEVAVQHAGQIGEGFVQRDGREVDREAAGLLAPRRTASTSSGTV